MVRDVKAAQEQNIELKKAIKCSRFFRDFFFPLGSPLQHLCRYTASSRRKNSSLKRFPRENSRQDKCEQSLAEVATQHSSQLVFSIQ